MIHMEKLAIDGGHPVRDTYISYGKQYVDEQDIAAVEDVLRSDFLTSGERIPQAEQAIRGVAGAEHAVAVSNGTTALHCACYAAGITHGDEVILPPITFAASANCVLYCGGVPVFADIDPHTWQLSPEAVEAKITPRTRAVIAVDYTGEPCNYDALGELCARHGLTLIEDAAHAFGTRYQGRPVGGIADMTTFSFHPVKTVTSGEGGAITTNSATVADKLRLFSQHGITHQHGNEGAWHYEQVELGSNFRITDIQCALLMRQIDKLPLFARRRAEITQAYNAAFADMPELTLQREYPGSQTVRHLYVVRLNTELLTVDRRQVFDALRAENIGVQVHYIPVYTFPYYARMGYRRGICPQAEALYAQILTLPLYYAMTDTDVRDVVHAVKKVLHAYRK